MSTTTTRTATPVAPATSEKLWPAAVGYGLAAAAATTVVAAVGEAAGISLAIAGEPIVLFAFAELTFVFSMVGLGIAAAVRRWSRTPRRTWYQVTAALTALSLVPDVLADADLATRFLLMATHLVAAAIVVPGVAARLRR